MRRSLVWLLLVASPWLALGGCRGGGQLGRVVRLRHFGESAPVFAVAQTLELACVDADGNAVTVSGEIAAGGTVRALCASLCASIKTHGIDAAHADTDPDADATTRAMDQTLTMPPGYHLQLPPRGHAGEGIGGPSEVMVNFLSAP